MPISRRVQLILFGFGILLGEQLAAPPISVAADLDEIRHRGHLIVGVKDDWSPLGYRQPSGQIEGFEIDIARHLAEAIFGDGSAVVLQPVSNLERLSAVLDDRVDLTIAGVAMTPERMRLVSFSVPYYLDGTGLVTRDQAVRDLNDLGHSPIAVLQGSDAIASLRYVLPGAKLLPVSSYQEALTQLEAGSVVAFAGDVTVLTGWVQDYPAYQLLPTILSAEPLAVVMPKGLQYDDLHKFVSDALTRWNQSGWLEERATFWGLP